MPEVRRVRSVAGKTMFPREYRLGGATSIGAVLRRGTRVRSGPLQVAALRPSDDDMTGSEMPRPYKIAVVTTRGFTNAVSRNRARRRAAGAAWRCRDVLRDGWDYVVIARPGVEDIGADELEQRIRDAAARAAAAPESGPEGAGGAPSGGQKGRGRARLSTGALRLYKRTLSPMLGAHCRYYPSCSQYAIDALSEYGLIRGWVMAIRRVLRCHPWAPGGYDPVVKPGDG